MTLKDILLHVDTYPEPTRAEAIDQAVAFAVACASRITALAVQIDLGSPSNWLADRLIGLSGLCEEEEARSLAAGRSSLADFSAKLAKAGGQGDTLLTKADFVLTGEQVAVAARTRDLCLVPVTDNMDGQRAVAETVVFESGRPVIVYQAGQADLPSTLGLVLVAWDGSRSAARALADALPLLARARKVLVATVLNEKPEARPGLAAEAVRHLRLHGVDATAEEVDAAGRKIGEVLEERSVAHGADLIVMGAYGRSRMREFILGGATEHMLRAPKRPLFLAH